MTAHQTEITDWRISLHKAIVNIPLHLINENENKKLGLDLHAMAKAIGAALTGPGDTLPPFVEAIQEEYRRLDEAGRLQFGEQLKHTFYTPFYAFKAWLYSINASKAELVGSDVYTPFFAIAALQSATVKEVAKYFPDQENKRLRFIDLYEKNTRFDLLVKYYYEKREEVGKTYHSEKDFLKKQLDVFREQYLKPVLQLGEDYPNNYYNNIAGFDFTKYETLAYEKMAAGEGSHWVSPVIDGAVGDYSQKKNITSYKELKDLREGVMQMIEGGVALFKFERFLYDRMVGNKTEEKKLLEHYFKDPADYKAVMAKPMVQDVIEKIERRGRNGKTELIVFANMLVWQGYLDLTIDKFDNDFQVKLYHDSFNVEISESMIQKAIKEEDLLQERFRKILPKKR